jgi:hypothetical protein
MGSHTSLQVISPTAWLHATLPLFGFWKRSFNSNFHVQHVRFGCKDNINAGCWGEEVVVDGTVCNIRVGCGVACWRVAFPAHTFQAEEREAKLASKAAEKDAKAAAKRAAKAEKRSEIAALRQDPSRAKRLRGRAAAARLEIDNRR